MVLEAADGRTALDVAERHVGPIHLLLTDVVLPGMNGRDLAESLSGRRPGIAVIYMSGYSNGTISDRGLLADSVELVEKPFTVAALIQAIRRALGG
jgi:CheY-like chemotaxis protein